MTATGKAVINGCLPKLPSMHGLYRHSKESDISRSYAGFLFLSPYLRQPRLHFESLNTCASSFSYHFSASVRSSEPKTE